jgi:hypothetical protein
VIAKEHYSELDRPLKNRIKYLIPDGIRSIIHPRSFHSFCIGTPKSGTTSIAGLFDKHFRSAHEPERRSLIFYINDHYHGRISDQSYIEWLRKRDRRVWLEIESNCFLGYRVDLLYRAFPNSKYILSVREPLSWLDSMINHTINYSPSSEEVIALWHRIFFQPQNYPHPKIEQPLIQAGVYSLEAYLRFWSRSINNVLNTIPAEQLFIIQTQELKKKSEDIADFLGIDPKTIDFSSGHLNQAPAKYHLLKQLPQSHIVTMLSKYAAETCQRLGFAIEADRIADV